MSPSRDAHSAQTGWAAEVLDFWFVELPRQQWFAGGAALDELVRARFLPVHRIVAAEPEDALLADADTALAAVIVLDQFSRNMFRGTPGAFASDTKALAIAEAAIAKGLMAALNRDELLFLYLPFEHQRECRRAGPKRRTHFGVGRSGTDKVCAGPQGHHRSVRPLPTPQRHPRPHTQPRRRWNSSKVQAARFEHQHKSPKINQLLDCAGISREPWACLCIHDAGGVRGVQ